MKSGRIKESQILSSSFYKETHGSLGHSPHQARLGGAGYWSPVGGSASIDSEQFLQLAFETFIQLKMVSIRSQSNKGMLFKKTHEMRKEKTAQMNSIHFVMVGDYRHN